MPPIWDVEDYAVAFVRFETGATLVLETSWLLHHDIDGEDMQIWLYGDKGGCHYPEGKFLSTNYETKQMYTSTLKITRDQLNHTHRSVWSSPRPLRMVARHLCLQNTPCRY